MGCQRSASAGRKAHKSNGGGIANALVDDDGRVVLVATAQIVGAGLSVMAGLPFGPDSHVRAKNGN